MVPENESPIRIVSPGEFDSGTAQTPGSLRLAAVAPQLGVQSAMWGGLFEVKPGARTGIHHHGEQQTIAYVLSGVCEIRWGTRGEYAARAKAGDFHPRACFPTTHGDQPFGFAAFSVGRGEEHLNANRREPSEPDVAIGGHDHLAHAMYCVTTTFGT